MKKVKNFNKSFMKISVFDNTGRRIYIKSGKPDECLKDAILNLKFNFQIINFKDIGNFNFGELDMLKPSQKFNLTKRLVNNE